jgi:hypothetical protein
VVAQRADLGLQGLLGGTGLLLLGRLRRAAAPFACCNGASIPEAGYGLWLP